jgi:hypothetical protein
LVEGKNQKYSSLLVSLPIGSSPAYDSPTSKSTRGIPVPLTAKPERVSGFILVPRWVRFLLFELTLGTLIEEERRLGLGLVLGLVGGRLVVKRVALDTGRAMALDVS